MDEENDHKERISELVLIRLTRMFDMRNSGIENITASALIQDAKFLTSSEINACELPFKVLLEFTDAYSLG